MDLMRRASFTEDSDMNRNLKYVIKLILSGLLLFTVLFGYNRITEPKYTYANSNWPTTSTFRQFYKIKKNTVDVLFFGSSFAVNAFDPQKIYEASGIRSYNLGSEQQSVFMSYWWLKEALRYQSPKAVVLETRYAFYKESNTPFNMNESFMRKSMDPMKWSKNKADAVHVICSEDHAQSEMSYYFTNLLYHSRWKEMTKDEIMMDAKNAPLKGFSPLFVTNTEPFEPITISGNEEIIPLDPKMEDYLVKMADLCRENEIELILVTIPATDMHPGMHAGLQDFADRYDLSYYDYAEKNLFESSGWNLTVDNPADHMNWHGAEHMSEIMAEMLKERGIPAVSDPQWENASDYHAMVRTKGHLSEITDLQEYMNTADLKAQTVFIAKDEGVELPDTAAEVLGVQNEDSRNGWLAVMGPDVNERQESNGAALSGMLPDGLEYYVGGSELKLNGSDYFREGIGLHITVYDPEIRKAVDEVCFVFDGTSWKAARD